MRASIILMAVLAICFTTGCSESAILAGNGASMVVACALLWSTINLGQSDPD